MSQLCAIRSALRNPSLVAEGHSAARFA